MGDDIGLGLSSMAVCFDFCSTNVVQLSNRNLYFYRFGCHHPLITQLSAKPIMVLLAPLHLLLRTQLCTQMEVIIIAHVTFKSIVAGKE